MGRPKEHGDETRALLLEHAGRLLQSEGPAALSLRRLADEVGTTTRAVYSLFGGKEGLLSAMYREMGDTLTRLHEGVPQQDDVAHELWLLCAAYRKSVRRHPSLYPLVVGGAPGFRPKTEDAQQARRGFARVLETLERGIEAGVFRGRSAADMGHQLWALVHGLAVLELNGVLGGLQRAERQWRDATTNLIMGFRVPPE
ncbi:MAG: TetR/AcrR family transcriptional regulator [Polyangiaceae bacterium]|nr:TetR/AcrR family transcriptional regulator [Polyangiaceae bacterium]